MTNVVTKKGINDTDKPKDKYRVTNWKEYNESLKCRGRIEIWMDEEAIANWYYEGPLQKGAQVIYSDDCITCLLQLKAVFKLGYRQLEGFVSSLMNQMRLDIDIPCYTQICRRAKDLDVKIDAPQTKNPIYLVIDSTGLKVYGEGEWKARKHGVSKRRTWRKLHLGFDEKTGYVHTEELTENGKGDGDAQQVKHMLAKVKVEINKIAGDGAYDTYEVWKLLKENGIEGIIPPQENAAYWQDTNGNLLDLQRNEILKKIDSKSRKEWKTESGYHRRSLSETGMMRFKTIFGPTLTSRIFKKQKIEASIKVKCLNKMTAQGMPISIKISAQ